METLLYLLILLIPIQLGRHFFFDFSRIGAIYSDYLIPTVYLTDIIIFVLILLDLRTRKIRLDLKFILFIFLLFISAFFIAENKGAAIYKLIKVMEFIWLYKIIAKSKIKMPKVLKFYALAIIYSSILAIMQFISQKSIGGIWWYFGERSFYANTPGIAQGVWGNELFLRAYSSFAHPNLLGGFLALGLPLIIIQSLKDSKRKKTDFIYLSAIILGMISLILSFSRTAIFLFTFELALLILSGKKNIENPVFRKKNNFLFPLFILSIILSFILPVYISRNHNLKQGSLYEREKLISAALTNISNKPLFGVGLNNAIIKQYRYLPKNYGLFTQQPVHNIYLFIGEETGLTGLIFALIYIYGILKSINIKNFRGCIPFLMILILGFFDHYPVTLQQGMVLTSLFAGLAKREGK